MLVDFVNQAAVVTRARLPYGFSVRDSISVVIVHRPSDRVGYLQSSRSIALEHDKIQTIDRIQRKLDKI